MDRDLALSSSYHWKDLKPNRHRDKDSLWTEIWPSQVHITERDLNPNRHRDKDNLHQCLLQSQTTQKSISKPIGALQIDHVTQIQPMAGLYLTNKNDGKGAPLLKFNIPTLSNRQGQRLSPLAFISPKGTLNPIDIEIRTIYDQRCGPIVFISHIWTLNRIDT